MPYISFLNAWQQNNIDKVDDMLASDVVCYKMDKSRKSQILSREELLDLFKTRLEEVEKSDLSWSFDVIHRARLENEQLILFYVYANDFTDHQKRH